MPDDHVFFVPGILGTELLRDGKAVWSRQLKDVLYALVIDPAVLDGPLTPGEIIPEFRLGRAFQRPLYGRALAFLGQLGYSKKQGTLTEFGYDWRRDLAETADQLAEALRAKVADGAHRIAIVSHSMGGLVARCALSQGPELCEHISHLIQIGVPVRGAATAYVAFRQRPRFKSFLSWINGVLLVAYGVQSERLTALHEIISTFDAAFQLLPPEDEKILLDKFGEHHSALKQEFWRENHEPFLARARTLHTAIDRCTFDNAIAYYSEAADTPATYRVNDNGDILQVRTKEPGDGTVVAFSARRGSATQRRIKKNVDHAVLMNCKEVFRFLQEDLG